MVTLLPPLLFFAMSVLAYGWAKGALSTTRLNRRIALTVALYFVAQGLLGVGGWFAGISILHLHLVFLFAWALTHMLLAIWAERWFALPAAVSAIAFLVAAAFPGLAYPLMSLCNLVLTAVVVRVWLPRQDLALIRERRRELRRRATRWLRPADQG
jgi:hypothetical protein